MFTTQIVTRISSLKRSCLSVGYRIWNSECLLPQCFQSVGYNSISYQYHIRASTRTVFSLPKVQSYNNLSVLSCYPKLYKYHPNSCFTYNLHFSQNWSRTFSKDAEKNGIEHDDLKAILKDKSLGLTAKFKIIFQQYGVLLVIVHLVTSTFWVALFYFSASRGIDIVPYLESWGVFDWLDKWGFSYTEKLKTGGSNLVMTYLLYEIAKPIRYMVTLFGTMYSVRYLRLRGFLKPPPKSATVSELVQTQRKIMDIRIRRTTKKYKQRYNDSMKTLRKRRRGNRNGQHQ